MSEFHDQVVSDSKGDPEDEEAMDLEQEEDTEEARQLFALLPRGSLRILCVGEKPSIAQSIAKFLSRGHFNTRKQGVTPIHGLSSLSLLLSVCLCVSIPYCHGYHTEFPGTFRGDSVFYRVTAVTGHGESVC